MMMMVKMSTKVAIYIHVDSEEKSAPAISYSPVKISLCVAIVDIIITDTMKNYRNNR